MPIEGVLRRKQLREIGALTSAGAFATLAWETPAWALSYLVAAALPAVFGTVVLFARLRVFDRLIFARSASS